MSDTVILIQARLASTRFPRKVLADLCGKPILQHVIERCLVTEFPVVLCTSDWELSKWCMSTYSNVIAYHERSYPLERFASYLRGHYALDFTSYEYAIRVNADCPLIEPETITALNEKRKELENWTVGGLTKPDYVAYKRASDGVPAILTKQGLPELIRVQRLLDIAEHVTAGFYGKRWIEWIDHPCDEENAVDTPEDLERIRQRCLVA